jgi:hypothetical protein
MTTISQEITEPSLGQLKFSSQVRNFSKKKKTKNIQLKPLKNSIIAFLLMKNQETHCL